MTQPQRPAPLFRPSRSLLAPACFVVTLLAGLVSLVAADAAKIGTFWIDNVSVQGIANDEFRYVTPTGSEAAVPLAKLGGLKLTAYTDLIAFEDALAQKNNEQAFSHLDKLLRARFKDAWLKGYVQARMVSLADAMGKARPAIDAYLALCEANAEPTFLATVPEASLQSLDAAATKATLEQATKLLPRATGKNGRPALEALIQRLQSAGTASAAGASNPATPSNASQAVPQSPKTVVTPGIPVTPVTPGTPGTPVAPVAAGEPSKVAMPRGMPAKDPVAALLRAGDFQTAMDEAKKSLATVRGSEETAMRLYQLGLAQLYLGEERNDQDLVKDAGLNFMRIVVFFAKRPGAEYIGPSLLEAGRVHQILGKIDLARGLYDRAGNYIDPPQDPELSRRCDQFRESLRQN